MRAESKEFTAGFDRAEDRFDRPVDIFRSRADANAMAPNYYMTRVYRSTYDIVGIYCDL